jgi:hypothetical protein
MIDSVLPTSLRLKIVAVMPKRRSTLNAAYWYRLLTALRLPKKHNTCRYQIYETVEQGAEQNHSKLCE